MPVTRRQAASTEAAATGEQEDCPLEQCGNARCTTRIDKKVIMERIEKYKEWKEEQPWLCKICGYH